MITQNFQVRPRSIVLLHEEHNVLTTEIAVVLPVDPLLFEHVVVPTGSHFGFIVASARLQKKETNSSWMGPVPILDSSFEYAHSNPADST